MTAYYPDGPRTFGPTEAEDGYVYRIDEYGTMLRLDHLRRDHGDLVAELTVESDNPMLPRVGPGGRVVHSASFNVSSAAARRDRARFLAERTDADCWKGVLEELCVLTLEAERAGRPAVRLAAIPRPEPEDNLVPAGVTLPRSLPAMLFGDGGSGKTYVAQRLALDLVRSGLRVGWFDWEFDSGELAERFDRLAPGEDLDVFYARCERPLVHEADRLTQIVRDQRLDYVVLDSVAFACDGPAVADEVASAYFRALRRLRVGSLNIAHNTKAGDEDKPFGSAFWANGARATWFVKRSISPMEPDRLSIALYNRKWNLGGLLPAVGFDVTFGPGRTTFEPVDVADVPELADRLPVWQRVAAIVRSEGAMTLAAISGELDVPLDTVSKAVRRGEGKVFVRVPGQDGVYRIGLLDRIVRSAA